jgi:D-cysteine desulfhydrase/L-cysteate sulfo-lyase
MVSSKRDPRLTVKALAARLAAVPRVRLAALPTPLEQCRRLSEALGGPNILVKRDDLTGLAFGGNKTRNLEYRLAEAVAADADTVVVALNAVSNSARQTVAAANRLGMRTVLVLSGKAPDVLQGNLLVNDVLGADMRFTDAPEGELLLSRAEEVTDGLRREGCRPFLLNGSSMFAIASALAYVICTIEITQQLDNLGYQANWIYLSSRSKGQAGVVLGAKALGVGFRTVGIAAAPNPDGACRTARIANDAAALLGLNISVRADEISNDDGYTGAGYGLPSPAAIEAIKLAARTEGLILDPVYTGKAMAGLIDHIRQGRIPPSDTVVFIHTGGTPAIFAHAEQLQSGSYLLQPKEGN